MFYCLLSIVLFSFVCSRSSSDSSSELTPDDERMIRGSLFRLIKFYMSQDGTYTELHALLTFIFDVDDQPVVSDDELSTVFV